MTTRQSLRQHFRALRQQLSDAEQEAASHALLTHLPPFLKNSKRVALYLASDGEINLTPTIEYCWQNNIETYVPVLHPFAKGYVVFVRYQVNTTMTTNKYGIEEPILRCQDICPTANLDTIFCPLVAFDKQGNRMGMGGGYYDRSLASVLTKPNSPSVVGIAHDCQQTDALETQSWDIPMRSIVTSRGIFTVK